MKTASPALKALLLSSQFQMADVLTISSADAGIVLRLTSWQTDLVQAGETFHCSGMYFQRGKIAIRTGLQVDSLDLTLWEDLGGASWSPLGQSLQAAFFNGVFAGGTVLLQRTFLPLGESVWLFSGRVSDAKCSRGKVQLTVKSPLELLDRQWPVNIYETGCSNTLYDANCTLAETAFTVTGTVDGTSTTTSIVCNLPQASDYFTGGVAYGFGDGLRYAIKQSVLGGGHNILTLVLPLGAAPEIGQEFQAFPGCDKTTTTCLGRFANLDHFRGEPFAPAQEVLK